MTPNSADPAFAQRYGPWAVVAGASDGVGAAYTRAMAQRGVNVVLLARRLAVLDEVAAAIRADTGVETRAVTVDLAQDDAMATVAHATADVDVGMLMYNAGADPVFEPFLDNPVELALGMIHRNCVVPTQMCHHFGATMAARGAGGIVLVSSGAGLFGARNMVAYGATKAFDTVMAEALWAELHDQGVDVLGLVLGATDTPAFARAPRQTWCARARCRRDSRRAHRRGHRRRGDREPHERAHVVRRRAAARGCQAHGRPHAQRAREDDGRTPDPDGRTRGGRIVKKAKLKRGDRQDIVDVLVRYATGIDTRDWVLFETCFTDDCDADYGDIGHWHTAAEITAWMEQTHAPCGHTLHRITNHAIAPHGDGATARSYVDAVILGPDNRTGMRANGFYDDELVRTGDGWKIARRRFTMAVIQPVGDDQDRARDIEAIKQLKARYFRTMDSKDWDAMRRVFADDFVMDSTESGGSVVTGGDACIAFLRETIGDVVTVHQGHTPEITLTSPTTATGIWAMEDMLRWPNGTELHGYGHYHETYAKVEGAWRIATLKLTRLRMDFREPTPG